MLEADFNAYRKDGWHIFKLIKTKEGDGNAVKGMYKTPKGWNDTSIPCEYHSNWVYGGVPPKDIVAIDWDVKNGKKQGDKSFELLQRQLNVTLENTVSTPSGGGHCYVRLKGLPEDTPKLKKAQTKYPDIDFQSHGSEFVVLGGQKVEGYGEYEFDGFEYFVNDAVDFSSLDLRAQRVQGEGYSNIDVFEHLSTRPDREEIVAILDKLDPDMEHDAGWREVIMALNSWDLNGADGLQLAFEWSSRAKNYSPTMEDIENKYRANVADAPQFYNKLFTLRNQVSENDFNTKIKKAETLADLEAVATEIQGSRIKNTHRDDYVEKLCERSKEIHGKPEKVKWKKMVKYIDHEKAKQRQEDAENNPLPDFIYTDKGVKYLDTYANLCVFMEKLSDHKFTYDEILKRLVVDENYEVGHPLAVYKSMLWDELLHAGLNPRNILASHFEAAVFNTRENGLLDYVEDLPEWDGVTDYIGRVADTLTTENATVPYKHAVMKSIAIQAIAAWDGRRRTSVEYTRLESVLVFVGKQGGGKTTWVGSLMPDKMKHYFKDGVELDPRDKDSLIEATSAGLVELGELDATTKKADISSLKAYLSNLTDEFRAPYGQFSERYMRQTVYVGTVNSPDFLKDATGSRRFLVLDVTDVTLPNKDDVRGMWAQAFALYLGGADWRLEDRFIAERDAINKGHTDIGIAGDKAEDFINAVKASKGKRIKVSTTKVLEELGVKFNARERSDFISLLVTLGLKRYNDGKFYLPSDAFDNFRMRNNITVDAGEDVSHEFQDLTKL